jgi:hypothetical protein
MHTGFWLENMKEVFYVAVTVHFILLSPCILYCCHRAFYIAVTVHFILLSPCIFTNTIYFTPTNAHVKQLFL